MLDTKFRKEVDRFGINNNNAIGWYNTHRFNKEIDALVENIENGNQSIKKSKKMFKRTRGCKKVEKSIS